MATHLSVEALEDYIMANWKAALTKVDPLLATVPMYYENVPRPADGDAMLKTFPGWCRLEIEGADYDLQGLTGDPLESGVYYEEGIVRAYISVPQGSGGRVAGRIASAFLGMLAGRTLPGRLTLGGGRVGIGASGEIGNWWIRPVSVDWRRG